MAYTDDNRARIRREFFEYSNMAPRDLERWLKTPASKSVGAAHGGGESTGHASGRRIVELKHKTTDEMTTDDYRHMAKVINYIKRHSAQRPSGDIEDTRWRYSLMNWGHDPLKEMNNMTTYTKPDLRERLKEQIKASGKGGRKGQWSARKAQMLAQEYKRQGGGYVGRKRTTSRHLDRWTEEHWQTREGTGQAKTGDGMKRYLPERAWKLLSEEQKKETERKKQAGRKQFVPNTRPARAARAYVDHGDASMLDEGQLKRLTKNEITDVARTYDIGGRSRMKKADLAHVLSQGFSKANSGMTRDELLKQADAYGVKHSRSKGALIHDIVHTAAMRT